jgi:hypothetical protein
MKGGKESPDKELKSIIRMTNDIKEDMYKIGKFQEHSNKQLKEIRKTM